MFDANVSEKCGDAAAMTLSLGSWSCCSCAPGSVSHPDDLDSVAAAWLDACVPGTVASTLKKSDRWDMQHPPMIDSFDWWYRTEFAGPEERIHGGQTRLCFDGLATLAEVWLNGELLLNSDNMFRQYRLDVSESLLANNELVIGFRSVTEDLQLKRKRPRWKTNLVNHQQLRWRRTALLGRIPGWSPPAPAIGPWRAVRLENSAFSLSDIRLVSRLKGSTGVVAMIAALQTAATIDRAWLRVGECECEIEISEYENGVELRGELQFPDAPLWWPHTHGSQPLFRCEVIVQSGPDRHQIDCGQVGFRHLDIDCDGGFSIKLNNKPIYCRGACWTISDAFNLDGTEESLRRDLTLARDAGANMLRVIGTMIYESDAFYRICDELGIFVWQDFMFANMDYPVDDPSFADGIRAEAIDQLRRLSAHPSVIIYCGNSEVEQQAAMLGMPRELWSNSWFADALPKLCADYHPGTEYVASTPTGGVLPFHPSMGISHFYGVGAYLRSPAELRQTNVKFTPECLGFANIPEPDTINAITNGALPVVHHPNWKQRVPRDTGAGWDFEDVRDHYLKQVYGLDPIVLRSTDMPRYLELSRVVTGEMMAQTFSEWRGTHSHNRGGLVWFFKDLWPAAGWGIIDSFGTPKAAYYFLKRTWQNRQITLTDEGLNGLHIHVINEVAEPFSGFVEVTLLKEPNIVVAKREIALNIHDRGRQLLNADEILGGFYDVSYAYRFGPIQHDVVVATLFNAERVVVSEAFHFARRRESIVAPAVVDAVAERISQMEYRVTLQTDRFLHNVRLDANGFTQDDNYFHLIPQRKKVVNFRASGEIPAIFRTEIEALNLENPVSVTKNRE